MEFGEIGTKNVSDQMIRPVKAGYSIAGTGVAAPGGKYSEKGHGWSPFQYRIP